LKENQRDRETQYEELIRQLRRQLDEALFMADKAKKEGEFSVALMKEENSSNIKLVREEVQRAELEKELLRGELGKMKAFY
jgi:hypothetical protein